MGHAGEYLFPYQPFKYGASSELDPFMYDVNENDT